MDIKSRIIPIIIVSFILLIPISMSHKFLSNEEKTNLANRDFSITMYPNNDGEWNHTYGARNKDEAGYCIQKTSDGGFIILGVTVEGIKEDFLLIKTDGYGNLLWMKTLSKKQDGKPNHIEETSDGGYILIGTTFGSDGDIWLVKTDRDGNIVWDKILGTPSEEEGYCVHQTSDGGYILCGATAGYSNSMDAWLVKTDKDGNIVWDKTFSSGSLAGGAYYVDITTEGGYIITGHSGKDGGGIWLIKTDKDGNKEWNKVFGRGKDEGHCVHQTSDGGYIITGCKGDDIWLIKTDGDGNMVWNRTFGGGSWDRSYCVQHTSDEGYIIVGSTHSYDRYGGSDLWIIKTDNDGNKVWGRILGGRGSDTGFFLQETSDGGFVVVGYTDSFTATGDGDVWLAKIVPDNLPPSKPVVTGSSTSRINKPFTVNFSSVDPEGDDIYYFVIAWYVGVSGWIGPYKSGETVSFTVFNRAPQGVYNITVKAIDSHGWESVMSDPLRVTFPKPFWLDLLPSFLQRILSYS